MTTIIITDDMIGCDSSLLIGTRQHACPFPKVFVDANGVWAFAGSPSMAHRAIRAIVEEQEFAEIVGFMESAVGEDSGFEVIRIWEDDEGNRAIRCWTAEDMYGYQPPLPMAMGTGGEMAIGAYFASDKSVVKAMNIAIEHDANSCGPVAVEQTQTLFERHVMAKKKRKDAAKA